MMFERAICWIRRDLRLSDHVALARATESAREVAVVFVFDRNILDALDDRDDKRLTFIHATLAEMDAKLRQRGSRLIVLQGDPVVLIPDLCQQLGAQALFFNGDVEPYALQRDAQVRQSVKALGIKVELSKDHVVFARREVLNQSEEPFRVFTPYSKAWKAKLRPADIEPHDPDLQRLIPAEAMAQLPALPTLDELGFEPAELWLQPGEDAALARLEAFAAQIDAYGQQRDLFAIEGTSGLSVHLRHGTISPRTCVRAAMAGGFDPDIGGGRGKWLNELIWREFYQMILSEFPHVVESAFRPEYMRIEWPGSDEHFEAWCEGRTGYPVVDAAMRCLVQTGWMHNRLRMIAAMFLTKDLLVDWRKGEAFFARYLLDFDLASNNGGWQWSASTGVDAQPYFRIFNPLLQSRKFDPDAGFIARWCPELAGFSPELRHWPHDATLFDQTEAGCLLGEHYPHTLVAHHEQKDKAIALFKIDPQ